MMIEVEGLSKTIRGHRILSGIDLSVGAGEIVGLSGPNGSGKTMLMRAICGLVTPSEGSVRIKDEILHKDISFPRSIGVLLENPAFLDHLSGFDNLKIIAGIKGIISDDDIEQAIRRVGLDPSSRQKYRKYSLGMKQRLGIAAAVMESPEIVVLDEPTNALDRQGVALAEKIIREEAARGASVVVSCHDRTLLESLADRIFEIENGRIVAQTECCEKEMGGGHGETEIGS